MDKAAKNIVEHGFLKIVLGFFFLDQALNSIGYMPRSRIARS